MVVPFVVTHDDIVHIANFGQNHLCCNILIAIDLELITLRTLAHFIRSLRSTTLMVVNLWSE